LGHRYGIETEEYRTGMHAMDDFIGRFLQDLDRQFGEDYLLFFTSDHGFGPITSLENERRHSRQALLKGIDKWFGMSVTTGFLDNNIYVDTATLNALGYAHKDVCNYLLQYESSWVIDCLTEEEIAMEHLP
jgi:predicted AlkP superfamily pyrophosphatase or phosphodiesterase